MSEADFQTNDFPESEGVEEVAEQETTPPLITMEDADSTTFVSEQDTSPKTEELVSFDETPSSTVEDIPASNEGMMDGFEILPPTEPAAAAPADTSDSVPDVKQTVVEEEEPAVVTNGTTATEHSEPQSSSSPTSWPAVWLLEHNIDERVVKLLYWYEWQQTAGVFGGILFLLLSLTCYSFISVVTTFCMALLAVSFLYRIGMTIVNAVQKTSAEHPFRQLLDEKIELSESTVQTWAESTRVTVNNDVKKLQHLFLINDVVDSLKFGVMLWLVSYIGSWFSMLTLVILGVIAAFTLPKLYEMYQTQVDQAFGVAKTQVLQLCQQVEEKIPAKLKFYSKDKKE